MLVLTITDFNDNIHIIKNVKSYSHVADGLRIALPHRQEIPDGLSSRIINNGSMLTTHEIVDIQYFTTFRE